jgi:hypothetical protein
MTGFNNRVSTGDLHGLPRRAVAAYREYQLVQKVMEEHRQENDQALAIKTFEQLFSVKPQRVGEHIIYHDGLEFSFHRDEGEIVFELLITCPNCGEQIKSRRLHTLADVGMVLVNGDLHVDCPKG